MGGVLVEHEGRPHKLGVIFLPYKKGLVLLEDRIDLNNSFYGYTIIPGGKVERLDNGELEKPEQAVVRELGEEYGLEANIIIPLDTFVDFVLTEKPYLFQAFLVFCSGEAVDKEPLKSRHRWVTLEEAENLVKIASGRNVLARASRVLK